MQKLILIITLCVCEAACAGPSRTPASGPALLNFSDLATEITVAFEEISETPARTAPDAVPLGTP